MSNRQLQPEDSVRMERDCYFKQVSTFDWLDEYFRTQALQAELKEMTAEKNRISSMSTTKTERAEALRQYYGNYQERRLQILSAFFDDYKGAGDPFKYLKDSHLPSKGRDFVLPPFIEKSEIEKICLSLREGGVSQKEKNKKREALEKRIQEIEAELCMVFPDKYAGRNREDMRAILVKHWIHIQSKASEPVNPEGWNLGKYGTAAEKIAWKKLNLSDFVNKQGIKGYDPYPNSDKEEN